MYGLILSKENIDLSITEATELLSIKKYSLVENILICNIDKKKLKKIVRLSYTKKVLKILFSCLTKDLEKALLHFNFKKYYKKNFCLRIHNIPDKKNTSNYETKKQNKENNEAYYSKYIWKNLELHKIKPSVNLDKPETLFEIINYNKKSLICKTIWVNNNKYELRKAHLRPEKHPTSMHPRLAAALINILNPKKYETIIDPFCGSGGILLEAKIMGIKAIGYDIDEIQIKRAKINLNKINTYNHNKEDNYNKNKNIYKKIILKKADSTKLASLKNVVTDLPYGKSSKKTNELNKLYIQFIKKISGKSVVVFPDFSKYDYILKKHLKKDLSVKKIITQYVHKSLSRKIVLIDKKNINNKYYIK